jgi:protein-disulfide isomerase
MLTKEDVMRTLNVHALCVIALLTTIPVCAEQPLTSPVAKVGGHVITATELDRAVGFRTMRIKTEEFQIRTAALQELIAEQLLRDEAARRNMTVDALLKAEVDSKVAPISASDVETFYESVKERFGGLSRDEALHQIGENIHRQKLAQRKLDYVSALRSATSVSTSLDAPRAEVQPLGPSVGRPDAPITIVEFADFECPFCSRAVPTVHRLQEQYGDRIRVVFRDYPLPSHRGATHAAEAVHCAGDQGKFWEMSERLFSRNGSAVTDAELARTASEVGVDPAKFSECVASGRHKADWEASQAEGTRVGVVSTPTFYINGRMIIGAAPYESFTAIINEELARAAPARVSSIAAAGR